MKHLVVLMMLAWGAMMLEQARPELLPAGAVLVPLAVTGMLWTRSGIGVFAGGGVLLIDWIARPQGLPLVPVILTCMVAFVLASRPSGDPWTGRRRRWRLPEWLHPLALSMAGISLLVVPTMSMQSDLLSILLGELGQYAMIAVPLSLLLTGLMKLAGEFGFRRLA